MSNKHIINGVIASLLIISVLVGGHRLLQASSRYQLHPSFELGRGAIEDLAWNPQGELLAVASRSGIWIYDNQLGDYAHLETGRNTAIAWYPNTDIIITGSINGDIAIVDATSQTVQSTFKAHDGRITSISPRPIRNQYITSSYDGTLSVWGPEDTTPLHTIQLEHIARSVFWNFDGTQLAMITVDRILTIWQVSDLEFSQLFSLPLIDRAAWGENGDWIAAGNATEVGVWSVSTQEQVLAFYPQDMGLLRSIHWQGSNKLILGGFPNSLQQFDITSRTLELLPTSEQTISLIAWASGDTTFASVSDSESSGAITLWDTQTWMPLYVRYEHYPLPISSLDWHNDLIAAGGSSNDVILWDSDTQDLLVELEAPYETVNPGWIGWNPTEDYLLTHSESTLVLWDTSNVISSTAKRIFPNVSAAVWSLDGRYIVYATDPRQNTVEITRYDMDTEIETQLLTMENRVVDLAVSSENMLAIAVAWDGNLTSIRLWDLNASALIATLPVTDEAAFLHVSWHPDGRILSVVDSTAPQAFLIDIATLELSQPWLDVIDIQWSPDGQYAAVSRSSSLEIWDANLTRVLTAFDMPEGLTIYSSQWDVPNSSIALGCSDGIIRIYDLRQSLE